MTRAKRPYIPGQIWHPPILIVKKDIPSRISSCDNMMKSAVYVYRDCRDMSVYCQETIEL